MRQLRRRLLTLGPVLLVAACAGGTSQPSSEAPAPSNRAPSGIATSTATPSGSPVASASLTPSLSPALAVPDPGRPFEAAAILAAMRDSRRPGGVPNQLETGEIAAALADRLWTVDGSPWETAAAGGACGPAACTLELAGRGRGFAGEDVWVFSITPSDGSVELVSADLHALPAELAARLDALARGSAQGDELEGLVATSVRWLPPPDEGRFLIAYRTGDEEGSCAREVTVDAASGSVEVESGMGC